MADIREDSPEFLEAQAEIQRQLDELVAQGKAVRELDENGEYVYSESRYRGNN